MSSEIETEGKYIANALYNATITTGLAVGISQLGKQLRMPAPKLDFSGRDLLMVAVDLTIANMAKSWLIKQGILPQNIM